MDGSLERIWPSKDKIKSGEMSEPKALAWRLLERVKARGR